MRHEPLHEAYRLISKYKLAYRNPLILHSETFGKEELNGQSFDYIWVSQLVYHLSTEQTTELFEQVASHLKPTGIFVFDIIAESEWGNVPYDAKWRDFPFFFENSKYYFNLAISYGLEGYIHGTLEKYGYPEREGLEKE